MHVVMAFSAPAATLGVAEARLRTNDDRASKKEKKSERAHFNDLSRISQL